MRVSGGRGEGGRGGGGGGEGPTVKLVKSKSPPLSLCLSLLLPLRKVGEVLFSRWIRMGAEQ